MKCANNYILMGIPWMRAVFDGFLTVLAPSVAIVEVIHFTLCHERKSWLSLLLLVLLFWLEPKHGILAKTNNY